MSTTLRNNPTNDFMDPYSLLQLADDTNILAESIESLCTKFSALYEYSDRKCQYINLKKTKYMHMSNSPTMEQITLLNGEKINPLKENEGYTFLGFKLSYNNDVTKIIENNLTSKMSNLVKFYSWLDYNEDTPFFVKIKVLYTCLFTSLLYSVEAWGGVNQFKEQLLKIEREALKRCLGVKTGTSNDLVYIELNKADIISDIKDKQYKFYNKIISLDPEEAIVKNIWNLCESHDYESNMIEYYKQLQAGNKQKNVLDRKDLLMISNTTMCTRYKSLVGSSYSHVLYNSSLVDTKRKIITRWRLSCHSLKIETGRYTRPKTNVEDRKCLVCEVVEDEHHTLFKCKAHRIIRSHYEDVLLTYDNVQKLFNPDSVDPAMRISSYLKAIKTNMKDLYMIN